MNVAIIPARGGSVRIPRKNIRPFFGKPIIAYSIEAAKKFDGFDQVIVSTDDGEIAEIASSYGATVFWRQYKRLVKPGATRGPNGRYKSDDVLISHKDDGSMGTQDVCRDVLLQMPEVKTACVIYATAPLMSANDLYEGFMAVQQSHFNFAMSVGTDPLRDAAQFYWGDASAFVGRVPLIGYYTAMIPVDDDRVVDINTEEDWKAAERAYATIHGLEVPA